MPHDPNPNGGRLEDMAAEGTTIPKDAGTQRTVSEFRSSCAPLVLHCRWKKTYRMNQIPSVPRPDQINPPSDFAHANLAHAADNAFDIPRSVNDRGQTGEVLSGTGDQLSSNLEKKNLDDANFVPGAKGHDQYAKHAKQDNPLDSVKHGARSHDVEAAPGEEELSQDQLLDRRGAK